MSHTSARNLMHCCQLLSRMCPCARACAGMVLQALEALRVKGLAQAGKKAGRIATEGLIAQYIHAGAR